MVASMQKKSEKHGLFHCLFDAEIPAYVFSGWQRDLLASHLEFETRGLQFFLRVLGCIYKSS